MLLKREDFETDGKTIKFTSATESSLNEFFFD